MTFNSKQ